MPPTRGNMLAPRYLIVIEGTKLREDVTKFVTDVEYTEERNSASKIVMQVSNPRFMFLDEKIFAEGNSVDLWMGYAGKELHFMNRGRIELPSYSFPRRGMPRLTVTALDASRVLMDPGKKDRGKKYSKLRDSDIASKIFREEGFLPFTFQTPEIRTRVRKKGVSRWEFLQNLAKIHAFVLWVRYDPQRKANLAYFGPPDVEDQRVKHRFVYGTGEPDATLLEFQPKLSLPSQTTSLRVQYTDPKTRKVHKIRVEVERKDAERTKFTAGAGKAKLKDTIPNGPSVTLTVLGQREEVVADRRFKSPADAKRWAQAWFQERQNDFAFSRGVIVGSPDVRLGHVHELAGVGPRLSGDWQMTGVIQKMGARSLYETEFAGNKVALKSVVGTPRNVSGAKAEEAET